MSRKLLTRAETKKRCLFVLEWWDVEMLDPTYTHEENPGCLLQIVTETDDLFSAALMRLAGITKSEVDEIMAASDSHDAPRLRALVEAL